MRSELPAGTVTFLFTDIEGSTKLLQELGAEAYAEALAEHRLVLRRTFNRHGGVEVDTQGDAFFYAFPTAPGALAAAGEGQEALAAGPVRVRIGLHTGTPLLTEEGYVGHDVHRAARIAAAGHGGQVLVSASTAALVDSSNSLLQGIVLRDLGLHRLKDLSAPERVYQLGDGDFPPLTSLYRTNLPVPATPFLGRGAELAEVVELLTGKGLRLLTLTGPGGTGKTRLALQAAAEASESFPDGVFWVPLAPLRDPELVLPRLARTLALSEEPGTPLEETLVAHLSGKSLLLLLDNMEHLLPPAAERIAALRATNGSCLLVTSRERLRIGGEQTWPVPPLAEDDGTALFLVRSRPVDPDFTPTPAVEELCARLDELPLAIELAAARTAVFSTEQLLERLSQRLDLLKGDRDADPRQQTLRATIEWSHDLLSEDEQRLFARLAVFVGGCTYEAAEEVVGADPDTLQSLLDKSLLRKRDTDQEPRYWMLETIREYAAEKLAESGEIEGLGRRQAEYFLAFAEKAYPHLTGSPKGWLDRLEADHDNFRAAIERLEAAGETQRCLTLTGALWKFWYQCGYRVEGRQRLEHALAVDDSPTAARARALNGACALAAESGDAAIGRLWGEEALALHRRLGDQWGIANSIFMLGHVAADARDWAAARELFEESARHFDRLQDEHYILLANNGLAWACEKLGDLERARLLNEDNRRRARATGNRRLEAMSLKGLSRIARGEGRVEDALRMLDEAYRIHSDLGERIDVADILSHFALVLTTAGSHASAAQLLSKSVALDEELGASRWWLSERNDELLASLRTKLDATAFEKAWEEGRKLTPDEAVALALES
jgi:predicted ATPase/class 3 adenylate cyclase